MSTTAPLEPQRSAVAPWLGVGTALVALLSVAAVAGVPAPPSTTGAAGWFPPNGHRARMASGGEVAAVEWSRPSPLALAQSSSIAFLAWTRVTAVPWDTADYLRLNAYPIDAAATATGQREIVWVQDADGARVVLDTVPETENLVFEPGRLDLPAALRAGDSWTSSGEVARQLPGSEWVVHPYQASYRSSVAGDPALAAAGCLTITTDLSFAELTRAGEQTWCPGQGLVAGREGDSRWSATDAGPPPTPRLPEPFDWGRAEQLEFTSHSLNQVGTGIAHVSPVSPPGILPDGRVTFASQLMPGVLGLDPGAEPAPVAWHAQPGGVPTVSTSVGEITVVATSHRDLVGYGAGGQWLWQTRLSDIARVPPVLVADRTLVVATLDGQVTGLDLATGAELWRAAVGAEVRRPLVVAGDRVLVADHSGVLTCLGAGGVELWTAEPGIARSLAVSGGKDPLVVVAEDASPIVQAYSLADGERMWRIRRYDDARDIVAVGDRFLLRATESTTAIEVATGAQVWSWSQARTWGAVGGGDRALLLTDTEVVLLDVAGRQLGSWPHALGDISQTASFLSAGEGRVVAYGPAGMVVGRLP